MDRESRGQRTGKLGTGNREFGADGTERVWKRRHRKWERYRTWREGTVAKGTRSIGGTGTGRLGQRGLGVCGRGNSENRGVGVYWGEGTGEWGSWYRETWADRTENMWEREQ